jgi:hypothetical protein
MKATIGKIDPQKKRCDRCQQNAAPIRESSFTFRHPFRYWKERYAAEKGKRVTLRRQRNWAAETGFNWKLPPAFFMDLCPDCWSVCSRPFDGFPMDFWETVLVSGGSSAESVVPAKR